MTVDTKGASTSRPNWACRSATRPGRVNGIIPKPQQAWLSNVVFGGPTFDELYVTCGDKVFKRKTKAKGVLSFEAPIKPAAPRL